MNEKMKSRKFLFTALWNAFVLCCMVVTIILKKDVEYMGQIVTFAGTITVAFVSAQAFLVGKK